MKRFTVVAALLLFASVTGHPALAQNMGESSANPSTSDVIGNMKHGFGIWAPNEKVREIQRVMSTKGYYQGEIDGMLTPAFRRAIWNFQRDKGLPRTASLDRATLAALEIPAAGAASPGALPSSFGAAELTPRAPVEAP